MTEGAQEQEPAYERVGRFMQGVTLREMRGLSDDDLIERYDQLMDPEQGAGHLGPEDYLNELTRRETERQSQRIERLTQVLIWLTVVITIATLVLVVVELRH